MDFGLLIGLNIIVVIFAPILAGMFTRDAYGRGIVIAGFTFCFALSFSTLGWIIYVAVHFLGKYW